VLILRWLEGNIIPAENWRTVGFFISVGPKRAGTRPLFEHEEFHKTKKRQHGRRIPSRVLYKAKHTAGYWKVKENFWTILAGFGPSKANEWRNPALNTQQTRRCGGARGL
jgi:hypothetical protein